MVMSGCLDKKRRYSDGVKERESVQGKLGRELTKQFERSEDERDFQLMYRNEKEERWKGGTLGVFG